MKSLWRELQFGWSQASISVVEDSSANPENNYWCNICVYNWELHFASRKLYLFVFGYLLFSAETNLVDVWEERFPLPDNDFEFLEPLLALRTSMLQTRVKVMSKDSDRPEDVMKLAGAYKDFAIHLEMQAKMARQSNNPQVRCWRFLIIFTQLYFISVWSFKDVSADSEFHTWEQLFALRSFGKRQKFRALYL